MRTDLAHFSTFLVAQTFKSASGIRCLNVSILGDIYLTSAFQVLVAVDELQIKFELTDVPVLCISYQREVITADKGARIVARVVR